MTGQDSLNAQAADWLVRLQDRDVALEVTLEWQSWMNADARHAAAFARMEEAWEEPWELLGAPPTAHAARIRGRSGRAWAIAAAIGVLAIALGWMWWRGETHGVLQTEIGETRSVRLADGTQVTLGGDTRLDIRLGEGLRRIELARGEAYFNVAKDLARRFAVRAGDTTVTAAGTAFNVRRSLDRVVVAVIEGRVIVAPGKSSAVVQLDAGMQTTVSDTGGESSQRLADVGAATAWQSGRLAFRREPLRYVLEDVNRYARKPIVLHDERIGDLRFTGTVLGSSVEGWVESLEVAFALRAVEEPDRIVLRRAK